MLGNEGTGKRMGKNRENRKEQKKRNIMIGCRSFRIDFGYLWDLMTFINMGQNY